MMALTAHQGGTIVSVRAQPGARKNAVVGERGGSLRVAVSAAPERGKANAAIQEVLADAIGCMASQIGLLSGVTSRTKRFLIADLTPDELRRRLAGVPAPAGSPPLPPSE